MTRPPFTAMKLNSLFIKKAVSEPSLQPASGPVHSGTSSDPIPNSSSSPSLCPPAPCRQPPRAKPLAAIAAAQRRDKTRPCCKAALLSRQQSSCVRWTCQTVHRQDRAGWCRMEVGAPTLGWDAAEQTASRIVGTKAGGRQGVNSNHAG